MSIYSKSLPTISPPLAFPSSDIDFRIIVGIAGLLHDVCDHKYSDNDPALMYSTINKITGSSSACSLIKMIIEYGSYSKQVSGKIDLADLDAPTRFLRDCVSDADKIEAIGIVGIQRCISYQRELLCDGDGVDGDGVDGDTNDGNGNGNGDGDDDDDLIMADVRQHCSDKLLKLWPSYIYTSFGKAMGAAGHAEIVKWCEEYDERHGIVSGAV
jgi:hypothetical protein